MEPNGYGDRVSSRGWFDTDGGWEWLAVAAGLFAVGVGLFLWALSAVRDGPPERFETTIGVVTETSSRDRPGNRRAHSSVIEFVVADLTYQFSSEFGTSETVRGDRAMVFYDPADPGGTAITQSDQSRPVRLGLIIAFLALFGSFVAAVIWWPGSNPRRTQRSP